MGIFFASKTLVSIEFSWRYVVVELIGIDREGVVEIRAWLHHHAILLDQVALKVPLSLRSLGSCDVSEPKKYGLVP
jgi:hypothetical protein